MSVRQSNFELLRIIAMVMILTLHANLGISLFSSIPNEQEGTSVFFFRVLIQVLCIVSVNVFILISGWFGIKASWKGFFSIFFQTSFYTLIIALGLAVAGKTPLPIKDIVYSCLGGGTYWFVISYLILYILSPCLNTYIEKSTQKGLLLMICAWMTAQLLYGRLGNDLGRFHGGYSTLSFVGLYLIAAYMRRYPGKMTTGPSFLYFLIYGVLSIIASVAGFQYHDILLSGNHSLLQYNHPIIVLSSLAFFLAFSRISFHNNVINWLAASVFAIYLIQDNALFRGYYFSFTRQIFQSHSPLAALGLIGVTIFSLGTICILIDKLRILAWKPTWKLIEKGLNRYK